MGMTPSDVEQKTFSTTLRGYDLDEVDDFLDDVISTIRDLEDQIIDVKASKPAVQSATTEDESAIGRVLVTAQATADTMIADARDEASQILTDARSESNAWAVERDAKKAAAEEEMTELSARVAGIRNQLAMLATVVADRLDEMDESIGGQDPPGQHLDVQDEDDDSSDTTDLYVIRDDGGDEGDDDPEHGSEAGSADDEEDDEPGDEVMSELSTAADDDADE